MELIKDFSELSERLRKGKQCKVVAVEAIDDHSREAIERAEQEGWAEVKNIHLSSVEESAAEAVRCIRRGEAEVVMKGILNTDVLLRAIINKDNREEGLLPVGNVLSHVSAMQIPAYHKMLFMSDAAVIPFPTLEQRIAMIRYVIQLCRVYGIDQPRIALIHCTEKVSPKFPITLDYQKIVEMCQAGEFGNAIIDGPSDLKCAVDKESADIKGIKSPLEGNADAVIMPDIEAANVYYKAITAFTDTKLAVGLQGTSCPVTLTSRADSAETKYNSLAMACLQVLAEK
ncbi:MAG: phosphate butyryltransferase [Prevotella sp.]|nr:phosphate butyryltransferase [Prevotella sp.]